MSLAATRPASTPGSVDLLDAYAEHVATLTISKAGRAGRLRAAQRFLACHPDLGAWMGRPTPQRLVDLHRAKAWPFVSWCFIEGHLRPDLELLLAKPGGVELPTTWTRRHPDDVGRVAEVGRRFGWSDSWIRQVSVLALATMGCWAGKPLDGLTETDFAGIAAELEHAAHLSASARAHARTRLFALQQACYQLGLLGCPPRKAGPAARSPAELAQAIRQPELRREVVRYVTTLATTLQPASVYARAKAVMVLCDWLADHHPAVRRLDQLERTLHIEPFLAWARHRPWRGTNGRGRTVSLVQFHHDVVDLRVFFDDIACWGWASAPSGRLLFLADLPRLPEPVPRALPPATDHALMAAIAHLDDLLARTCLQILRATGMRVGELLDLELDCLVDFASHGTWLRVPLGKLATERMVPSTSPPSACWTPGWPSVDPNAPSHTRAMGARPTSCSWNGDGGQLPGGCAGRSTRPPPRPASPTQAAAHCTSPPTSCATPSGPASSTPGCRCPR